MIHLYAVARGTRLPTRLTGLEGEILEIVPCGSLEAVVTEHERSPRADRDSALRHAAVVAAVAEHAAVVPVRFGVEHIDRASLRSAVRSAESELLRSLERVGGHVEYVIRRDPAHGRGPAPSSPPAAPGDHAEQPGRRYLEQRLDEQRRARDAERVATAELRALTSSLNPLAAVVVERVGPRGPERCYLVERDAMGAFTAAASVCLADHRELVLGGPWPPYTFATEELGA